MTTYNEFVEYCLSFYDNGRPDAIYPMATADEIIVAAADHHNDPDPMFPFYGDSVDRESVRVRILARRENVSWRLIYERCVVGMA